ncbi:MFS transporter [bacterium]|nr:MFS transporter [bacterium]
MNSRHQNKNYRWNFTVNLLDGAFFWFGSSFISTATILPLFISKLTDSLVPIGLLSIISSAGWFLPQLFAARITEGIGKMKRIVIGWGIFLERLPIWLMVGAAFLARNNPELALVLLLVFFTWHTIGAGIIGPAWMALLAKLFSPEKRGSFMGITMFLGNGTGALGSALTAWLLSELTFPDSFIVMFLIGAIFITLSWGALALTREPVGEVEPQTQDWGTYWRDLVRILKLDRNFRRFILANAIITFGAMASGFITVNAIHRFQVSDATVGLFTLTMLLGQTAGNLVLGRMADRYGHKLSVEIGVLANLLAFLIAIVAPSVGVYYIAYALMGINASSMIVSGMMVVWEFCDLPRVPTYSGLSNSFRGLIGLVAPLIATRIAGIRFELLFGICTVLTLSGLLLLRYWVREPRWHRDIQEDQVEINA